MRKVKVWALAGLSLLLMVATASSEPGEQSTLEGQERAVEARAQAAEAASFIADQRSRAMAAYEFAAELPEADAARRLLAFTEAFNLATELSLPGGLSVPVRSLTSMDIDAESIFLDPAFQSNSEVLITDSERILGGVETVTGVQPATLAPTTSIEGAKFVRIVGYGWHEELTPALW